MSFQALTFAPGDPHLQPVKTLADRQFVVTTPQGSGVARYFATGSLDEQSTGTTRALINLHGALRNADVYQKTGEDALAAGGSAAGGTLLISPQFLAQPDVDGHKLPPETLRWDIETWIDGSPALAPAPLSSFAVLDALLERLADRERFPALREVLIVGHSGGGQMAQRYAVVGKAIDAVRRRGLRTRFVVANPSSYLYFDAKRPAQVDAVSCPDFNRWKYGFESPPPYVTGTPAGFEARYVARRVTYLLGALDTDPNHPVLDTSCAAEAQGPYRLARGLSYTAYLRARHPGGTAQEIVQVEGAGHDPRAVLTSPCGIATLFTDRRPACAAATKI